jgi:excisionase family DNA binding protein
VSALAEEIRAALREVLREELPRALAQLRPAPTTDDRDCLVGIKEAARRLGLSTSTAYKRAERCELPSVKDGGRLLFRTADLTAYAEDRRRSPERVNEIAMAARRPHNVIRNVPDNDRSQAKIDRASPEHE